MTMNKISQVNLRLPNYLISAVKATARKNRRSMAKEIEVAIHEYLKVDVR